MNYADIERTISELGEKVRWKGVCELQGQVREESLGRLGSERCSGSWGLPLLWKEDVALRASVTSKSRSTALVELMVLL